MNFNMAFFFLNKFVVFGVLNVCAGLHFNADIVTDLNRNRLLWKVSGDWQYARSGSDLQRRLARNSLPGSFKDSNFDRTSGIWALFPTPRTAPCASRESRRLRVSAINRDHFYRSVNSTTIVLTNTSGHPCDLSAYARFQFTLDSAILKSVTIRYNIGGNAVIRIYGENGQHPVEIYAKDMSSDGWLSFKIYLKGTLMLLEAFAENLGDYVLLDKIAIETQEFKMINGPTNRDAPKGSATGFTPNMPFHKPADVTSEASVTMNGKCASLRGASLSVTFLVTWLTFFQAVFYVT